MQIVGSRVPIGLPEVEGITENIRFDLFCLYAKNGKIIIDVQHLGMEEEK